MTMRQESGTQGAGNPQGLRLLRRGSELMFIVECRAPDGTTGIVGAPRRELRDKDRAPSDR